jgi:hypothetical protein
MATMRIACKGKKEVLVVGRKVNLTVGDRKVAFFVHDGTLSHFASGFRFGGLNDVKIREMCARGHNARLTDRQAAEILIARAIDRIGLDKVQATLAEVPTING